MDLYELPHTKIIKLSDDVAEVIVNEGVEYDMKMVELYHQWIRDHMHHPCCILVNKVNSYTYSFEAQRKLATIPEIKAIALVVYSRASEVATESLVELPKSKPWNSKIFSDREKALQWLASQQH